MEAERRVSARDPRWIVGSNLRTLEGWQSGRIDRDLATNAVALYVRPYLADVLSFKNVKAVITWQMTDNTSWQFQNQKRPLPFDANYQPKPFAYEIERAIIDRRV